MPTQTPTHPRPPGRRTEPVVVELHRWQPVRELDARRRAMAHHPAGGHRPAAPALTLVR